MAVVRDANADSDKPVAVDVAADGPAAKSAAEKGSDKTDDQLDVITLGSGCFWCTEAVFAELKGVHSATSGYSGGKTPKPTYEQVCTGTTGHAEVVQVKYDPAILPLPLLLEAFFKTHDPTTLNRQGADEGTQYRSAIFVHNDEQRKVAEHYREKLNESGAYRDPIVTEIVKFEKFYPAEKYHQDYFALNPQQGYCRAVIQPKMEKFRKVFREQLKSAASDAK